MEHAVNDMLHSEISKLNYTLVPQGYRSDVRSVRMMQEWITGVIDALGAQSASAQGLNKVITTADKLRNAPSHMLYLMKDEHARDGAGEVVGLLKVGRKHLFLWDEAGRVRELEPLCVLDFFVLRSRQRAGLGTKLFQHMLLDQQVRVEQLAIDGPSPKMEGFLARNYGVSRLLRQTNNFAVAPNFFANPDLHTGGTHEDSSAPLVGRFAAHKPASGIATVIHGSETGVHYEVANGEQRARTPPPSAPKGAYETSGPVYDPRPSSAPPSPEPLMRPATLDVCAAAVDESSAAGSAGGTPRRDSQLTGRGYFDVKFYHNKLW